MIGETYELFDLPDGNSFGFISEGSKGPILKMVNYTPMKGYENRYNLGFGDWIGGNLRDDVISNNDDLFKVMNTVAATVYKFFKTHKNATVFFQPVDNKRSRLYHSILRRRFHEIEPLFYLKGLKEREWQDFDLDQQYQSFELKLKS